MSQHSPCDGCSGAAEHARSSEASPPIDISRFRLPQVYHAQYPVSGHPLHALQFTLPPDDGVQRSFPQPIFHPDGSIEYPRRPGDWEPPAEINGYRRDPANKWRFFPLWPDCVFRLQGTRLKPDCGCIDVAMACNSPDSEHFGQPVRHTDCETCPLRVHGAKPASFE